ALVRTPPTFHFAEQGQGVEPERARLEQALAVVSAQIQRLVDGAGVASIREIFSAHLAMLGDPALREDVEARLGQGASAEAAWQAEVEAAARRQEALHDALLAERAADL
ncbi:phosphoenolpyruvate-utilizing N-terminal domain-containing protein, partial [Bowmanella yangjiangensis]